MVMEFLGVAGGKCKLIQPFWKVVWQYLIKMNFMKFTLHDPLYTQCMECIQLPKTCQNVYSSTVCISSTLETPKFLLTVEWIVFIHILECYVVMGMNDV